MGSNGSRPAFVQMAFVKAETIADHRMGGRWVMTDVKGALEVAKFMVENVNFERRNMLDRL